MSYRAHIFVMLLFQTPQYTHIFDAALFLSFTRELNATMAHIGLSLLNTKKINNKKYQTKQTNAKWANIRVFIGGGSPWVAEASFHTANSKIKNVMLNQAIGEVHGLIA